MKKLCVGIFVFAVAASVAFGWLSSDPPEGHIETAAGYEDGDVLAAATTTISTLTGTFQKGGESQGGANALIASRSIYMAWDRNRDGEISHLDEPVAQTLLTAQLTAGASTATVVSTAGFSTAGWVLVESEIVKYTGITGTTFTGLVRGVNETSDATHVVDKPLAGANVWEQVVSASVDGFPVDAVGWDSSAPGADDGTEGDVLQGETITVVAGRSYLLKLRVIDSNGNTNNEDGGEVDRLFSYGPDSYMDADGDAGQGLEDDEVLWIKINRHRRRYP